MRNYTRFHKIERLGRSLWVYSARKGRETWQTMIPCLSGAQEFASVMQTYYNYIRPHQDIGGLTPAEMVGIQIDLTGIRWTTMIGLDVGK